MEAALLHKDLQLVGSDIDERQIAGAQENTEWLMSKELIRRADADRISWNIAPVQEIGKHLTGKQFDAIVTEGYLGTPLSGHESRSTLEKEQREIEELWSEALPVLADLQPSGGRLVAVWPDLIASHGTFSVNPIQAAEEAGYTLVGKPLTYARPDQHVRRKIVILMKK
jgi:tRNA G10  N-methylase Trm11